MCWVRLLRILFFVRKNKGYGRDVSVSTIELRQKCQIVSRSGVDTVTPTMLEIDAVGLASAGGLCRCSGSGRLSGCCGDQRKECDQCSLCIVS